MLKAVLVCQDRQHALQPLIGELHHSAAALADQMLVIRLRSHGLVSLESFTEVMRTHESALHQQLESPIDGGRADLLTPLSQLTADCFDRKMVLGEEDNLRHKVSGASDGLVVLAKVAAKALGVGGCFCLIQSGHERGRPQ